MRLLGWTLITLGFVLLVLDITDVAYTAANFENDCDNVDYAEWGKKPCGHDDHIYAYIASGVWSSILVGFIIVIIITLLLVLFLLIFFTFFIFLLPSVFIGYLV